MINRRLSKILVPLLLNCATAACHADESTAVRVRVEAGTLIGSQQGGVQTFKGIPYAAPPLGALRGVLPQPVPKWQGELQATDYGHSCVQTEAPRNVAPGSRAAQTSEDCLVLNVWAPLSNSHAPVMVWLHGGGNDSGSSADIFYDGSAFARDGVVLVSLNYRLGDQANLYLWDQIAALHWVQQNIAAFGGDPANVTLFGESSGAQDTLALMTASAAAGLFHQAIIESAGGGWESPQDSDDEHSHLSPIADGKLLTQTPLAAFRAGHFAHMPVIIGTNGEEGSLLGSNPKPAEVLRELSADDLSSLRAIYGAEAASDGDFARLLFRDGYFAGPAQEIASALAQAEVPVYLYRFDYVLSVLQSRRTGAYHGSEIPYVFDSWPSQRSFNDTDRLIGKALHDCWVSFARTGTPVCASAAGWARFDGKPQWMQIDSHPAMRAIRTAGAIEALKVRLVTSEK